MMVIEGCAVVHSSVERLVREIPRWKVPRMRQHSGSPVECSLLYIACYTIYDVRDRSIFHKQQRH